MFVADPEASAVRAVSLDDAPRTSTIVGQGLFEFGDQDGPTSTALLQHPLAVEAAGRLLYVADTYNHKIKVVDPIAGQVTTLIGDGRPGMNDGPFEEARLYEPHGLRAAGDRLYIADTNNHVVRVADLSARRVATLRLRGLERLEQGSDDAPRRLLPPVQSGLGPLTLLLDLRLPPGCQRSPDAPTLLRLPAQDRELSFNAAEPLTWTVDPASSSPLEVDLAVYYCQEHNAGLCFIHHARLAVSIEVIPGGPQQARITYTIEAPDFSGA